MLWEILEILFNIPQFVVCELLMVSWRQSFHFCFSVFKVLSWAQHIFVTFLQGRSIHCSYYRSIIAGLVVLLLLPHTWMQTVQAASILTNTSHFHREIGFWWAFKWSDPKRYMLLFIALWPKFVTWPHLTTRKSRRVIPPGKQRAGTICLITLLQ